MWLILALAAAAAGACSRSNGNAANNPGDSASGAVASDSADPPARVARLSDLSGNVSLEGSGDTAWTAASTNYPVTVGDRLYTNPNSRAEVDVGTSAVRLDGGSDVTVSNLTDHFAQFGLEQGTMDASLYRWNPADSIELDTPNGSLMPLGAGVYRIAVDPNSDVTYVTDESGTIQVSGPGVNQTLQPGETVELSGTDPIQVSSAAAYTPTAFDGWVRDRDARFLGTAPALQYVSEDTPGWEDLDSNGQWETVSSTDGSGPAWCPSHLSSSWVPYRDGHWAWVQPWGWTWVDNQPWGYTTSHYGRWSRASCGWAWQPGPENAAPVYAPALVSFVEGAALAAAEAVNGPQVQGWFPLAPGEPYFPWYHHSDAYLRAVNLADLQRAQDIKRLLDERNLNNIRWANRTDALTAVPAAVIARGEPVPRQALHLAPAQLANVSLAPHPFVNPDPRLAMGGRAVAAPRVAARPLMIARGGNGRGAQPRGLERPVAPRTAGGDVVPNAPPAAPGTPNAVPRGARDFGRGAVAPSIATPPMRVAPGRAPAAAAPAPARAPRPIITRNAPPPPAQRPPFAAQQRAMQAHPGRPLEPQQMQNLRAGRAAGPMRDQETPAHGRAAAPAPAVQRAPPPAAAPRPAPAPARPAPAAAPAPQQHGNPHGGGAPPARGTPPAQDKHGHGRRG